MKLILSRLTLLATLAGTVAAGDPAYTYVDLGTLPGGSASVAYGMNDAGQVVGWSTIPGCLTNNGLECRRAYVWQNGVMTDLGKLAADEDSFARSINNNGLIVGTSESDVLFGFGVYRGVLWQNGVISPLPDLGNGTSFAHDVNDAGLIIGHSVDPSAGLRDRAVTWVGGVINAVGSSEPHSYNRLQGVNATGQMVGFAWNLFSPNDSIAFDGAKWSTIGGFGQFENSEASDVNDNGLAVGLQAFPSGAWHAATWEPGKGATDAGTLPGLDTGELYGVNNAGLAVGSSYDGSTPGRNRAILWDGTQLRDLNDFISPTSGIVLYEARDINENGDIVGTAVVGGQFRAFLLEAQPAWSKYGVGASPVNTVDLDGQGSTEIGQSLDAIATNVTGFSSIFAVAQNPASFPLFGGAALIDPTFLYALQVRTVSMGQASLTMNFPNDPNLVGLEVYVQMAALVSTAPNVWELSNGLKAVICPQ